MKGKDKDTCKAKGSERKEQSGNTTVTNHSTTPPTAHAAQRQTHARTLDPTSRLSAIISNRVWCPVHFLTVRETLLTCVASSFQGGGTPLHEAVECGHLDVVTFLIHQAKAVIDSKDHVSLPWPWFMAMILCD